MSDICATPYGTWAHAYRELGMWPRPLKYPGTDPKSGKPFGKMCKEPNWQLADADLPAGTIEQWDQEYAHYNIGLAMGSPFPDGTRLGALDIDHDDYVELARTLLGSPKCGRIGKKGAVFFVRYKPELLTKMKRKKFRVKGEQNAAYGQVLECLFEGTLCVIPPSIHPDTQAPYQWLGTPLHEIDFSELPLIGE